MSGLKRLLEYQSQSWHSEKRAGQAVCIRGPLGWGLRSEAISMTATWASRRITQCGTSLERTAWNLVFHSPRNSLASDSL